tara:strand:+ start:237 stop:347 length:111 start_codon:yes stop_codon:yes gene_type:complete
MFGLTGSIALARLYSEEYIDPEETRTVETKEESHGS